MKHGMANESKSLINVVIDNKLKVLRSLTKRYVVGSGVANSPDADDKTTGGEAEPNPCLVHMRNVVNQTYPWRQEGTPQGGLMAWLVQDEGESESRPVMGQIEVASSENIPSRESGQTSLWSFRARRFDQPT